ncbi:phosphatase [Acetobacterium woodii]|uniref:Putative hydrolase n=1 Tax=Acetobacterium woodii (strain ATCC 29683 / DSM 1030 / JCM 2381 / KCTC 1655 / WB1) TaxID=931626 RepID=H6LE50_ACEWD|nr:phosphatase [Acetobacterium woodii]AFA49283.1 putative hydrolase [Acetobacterium woodii DSM 1030]
MKNYVLDAHTHTIASGHAYNTILELIDAAAKKNLEMICVTEHGPALPGSPTPLFFANYRVIPGKINNVKLLKGIESNIMDVDGNTDIPMEFITSLEIISASLHTPTFKPQSKMENTSAVLGAIANPHVDFICHLGNPTYELDYEVILQDAKKHNTLIEINNGSFFIRKGSKPNCEWIANRCKELEIPIIIGSDTHFASDIGDFPYVDKVLEAIDFPDELIINLETQRLISYLENKGRILFADVRETARELF